jgi:hypothetical protein
MTNLTTAAIVLCPELPSTGLLQSMHDPSIKLNVNKIYLAPGISGDSNTQAISKSLIFDAIKRIHHRGISQVFGGKDKAAKVLLMPTIERLDTNTTSFWQLGGINENEGTIDGTYKVHDAIFKKHLGLDESTSFENRLFLVHGDQLTAQHIRAVKQTQSTAYLSYDRRDWMLGITAWFHIQMNLLNTLIRTHWSAPQGQYSQHCFQSDMALFNRSHGTRENVKYHIMAPMVAQSYTARVVALFYSAMEARGYLRDIPDASLDQIYALDNLIGNLGQSQFLTLIDDVYEEAFTLKAWNGKEHNDPEFTTMCRMLQEVELFLVVHHAVKFGDIGHMRRLVDPLLVFFLGASQHNYGREMLYYRWNLSAVNTPELQHAILASGLVNWLGKASSHKAIDLSLEHLNCNCKIEMKCYKNSTHNTDIIFNRVCLTNTWLRALRSRMETIFGEDNSGAHTTDPCQLDIFALARNVFEGGFARPRNPSLQRKNSYLSEDIRSLGMKALYPKVEWFNQQYIVDYSQVRSGYMDEDISNNMSEVTIGSNLNEISDNILDPTEAITIDGLEEGLVFDE